MRNQARLAVSIFLGLAALSADGIAQASIQSPPEEACKGKKVDDACALPSGEAGACKADKCNQLDYSKGTPPQSIEVDCIVCVAGAQPPPGPGPVEVGGGPGAGPGATGDSAPATSAEPTPAPAETTPEPPSSEARCSVTAGDPSPGWGISLLVLGLVAARRRRLG